MLLRVDYHRVLCGLWQRIRLTVEGEGAVWPGKPGAPGAYVPDDAPDVNESYTQSVEQWQAAAPAQQAPADATASAPEKAADAAIPPWNWTSAPPLQSAAAPGDALPPPSAVPAHIPGQTLASALSDAMEYDALRYPAGKRGDGA